MSSCRVRCGHALVSSSKARSKRGLRNVRVALVRRNTTAACWLTDHSNSVQRLHISFEKILAAAKFSELLQPQRAADVALKRAGNDQYSRVSW